MCYNEHTVHAQQDEDDENDDQKNNIKRSRISMVICISRSAKKMKCEMNMEMSNSFYIRFNHPQHMENVMLISHLMQWQ